jgi:hypothetical protein
MDILEKFVLFIFIEELSSVTCVQIMQKGDMDQQRRIWRQWPMRAQGGEGDRAPSEPAGIVSRKL